MSTLEFTQVDVFTERKLEGNPLAVFHSGAGLSTARMLAIAREMNLSETTFLFPASPGCDARVRIFTVREELPFAGHPTLGTAFVVAARRRKQSVIRLRMKVGVIPVEVSRRGARSYLVMRQKDPLFGPRVEAKRLASALGITAGDLDRRYPAQVVSTGVPFLIVPLRGRAALERLAPRHSLLRPMLDKLGVHFPYYLATGEDAFEARMFDSGFSGFEDPATGSAAGCAAAFLVRHQRWPADRILLIHQGRFVQRPSRIFASASLDGERAHNVRVGGYVVETVRGRLRL